MTSHIICNQLSNLWDHVQFTLSSAATTNYQIDIVLDNASYELFTDLALVQFLHSSKLFPLDKTKVVLHVKKMPWFVSDTLTKDVHWLINAIGTSPNLNDQIKHISQCFKQNLENGNWTIMEHDFWTLPHDFSEMSRVSPDLYAHLSKSNLILFKGDLNYRKLVGDLNWPLTTPFKVALRNFQPQTAVCTLRTIKADVVVGISDKQVLEDVKNFPQDWMETGEYAVIQFHNFARS